MLCMLTLCALVLCVCGLAQTFLYTGLYNWFMLRHMHPRDINEEHRQLLMQRSMIQVSRQTMKAALQVSSGRLGCFGG